MVKGSQGLVQKAIRIVAVAVMFGSSAFASSATYFLTSTDAANDPVNASVTFNWLSGVLSLQLQNLITDEKDVGQAISGLKFSLAGMNGTATVSGTGALVTVSSTSTAPTNHGIGSLVGWNAGTSLTAINITALGAGQPKQTILGTTNASGAYGNANSSIVGNGPHNDFVSQVATFTLGGLAGVNSATDIATLLSAVQIGFGTAGTNYLSATLSSSSGGNNVLIVPSPEPSTMWLAGLTLAFTGAMSSLRRRRRAFQSAVMR